jgi:uncharacterized protein (TIGR03083 family)
MTDRDPLPRIRHGWLLLQTNGRCDFDPWHLLDVFSRQRQRFTAVLHRFGPADWAAPTRCAEWSAHDVVRHLCDTNIRAAGVGPDDRTLDVGAGFDPRITPRRWLAASDGEPPDATLGRFVATTEDRLARDRARHAQGRRFDVLMPYGPADWTVRMLHGFWDSWLHERDVLLAQGRCHPTDADATWYATAYGVFLAAAAAAMFGDPVRETLTLGGDGGGVFDLDRRGGVTLTVTRVTAAGPPAAQLTDALAGRAPAAAVLGDLPTRSRRALLHMADFFNTPVAQSSARPGRGGTGSR